MVVIVSVVLVTVLKYLALFYSLTWSAILWRIVLAEIFTQNGLILPTVIHCPPHPPIQNQTLILNILVVWRKPLIIKITGCFVWGFQCYQFSPVEPSAQWNCHFYSKLYAMQVTPQLVPLVLLSTYLLTAVLTLFAAVGVVKPDYCHRLLTLILLCIYTVLRHIMKILTVNMDWQTAACYSCICLIITGPVYTVICQ